MTYRAKAAAIVLALVAALVIFVVAAAVRTWHEQSARDLPPAVTTAPVP